MDEKESLGRYLKRERESRNISLREIAKNTRVREHFLKAIEEDQYHLLPSTTYVKGFLLAYSKFIDLDPNEVILRYEKGLKGEPVIPSKSPSKKKILWNAKQTWIVGVVIVISLIISYFLYPFKPFNKSLPIKLKGEEILPPKIAETTSLPEEKPFSLQVKAVEKTWMRIQVNGQPEKEMTLKPGETTSYQARNRIFLLIGNAGGLDLIFNEKPLEKFGKSGEVVTLIFTPHGAEKRSPEKPKTP